MQTIPNDVLKKITDHRPHLARMSDNLRQHPSLAAQIEKGIANAYLCGETRLGALETWHLSSCCIGEKYGGGIR